jgi:alkane 1-monooxygenase
VNSHIRNILYLFSYTTSVAVILGNNWGGAFTLLNFIYSLVFLAIIEWIFPGTHSNNHSEKSDIIPKIILYLHIPFQLACLFSLFYGVYHQTLSGIWIFTAALSTGINSGSSAIVVAHEFIHCRKPWERWLGKLLLFTSGNIYFYIEHLLVHHRWVGTEKDHASANYGENIYHFFYRSTFGQIKGAIRLERERLKKIGKWGYGFQNYVIRQILFQLSILFLSYYFLGFIGIIVRLIQCFMANFLLEYVNYIQHYGLTRLENERTTEEHSWESNQFASRFVLVDLSRHADHHYYASKPYHTLKKYDHSPKLPSGYAGLFFIAAIPFLWKKVIHKPLDIYQSQKSITP